MSTVRLQEELSYDEALEVLGFRPGAIVSPHLPAFRQVEDKLCRLIETTGDEQLKTNFREELGRLNEALRVVEAGKGREPPLKVKGMGVRLMVSLLLVACIVGAGWWANQILLADRATKRDREIESLAVDGRIAVENRRWEEAQEVYAQIESLAPGSPRARDGFRRIEAGREAERRQKFGYLLGAARAAIEQRQWDEAEARNREVLEMDSEHEEALGFVKAIRDGRVDDTIAGLLEAAESALRNEEWEALVERTEALETMAPTHAELPRLREKSKEGMKLLAERRIQARQLYEVALSLDDGEYSQEGLDALRDAIRLADHPDFQALYRKMSGYTRLLEVPGEFPTIGAALQEGRDNDKIIIAAGTYAESLILNCKLDIEGAGPDKTIIECDAMEASVVQISREASGSRVARMTLRQNGISLTDERFPVVAIDGAELSVEDCSVENGAGHGVAVINGGLGRLRNVRVVKCGWDGLAVYGDESRADVSDSRFEANFHHGIDAWSGGRVEIRKSRCTQNGLAGVVLMSPGIESVLTQCTADHNREVGVLVSNGSRAVLRSNRAESNLLGGFLIEGEGTTALLERNVAEKNLKVGIVVDKLSTLTAFEGNVSRDNAGEQLQLKAELPREEIPPPPAIDPPRAIPVEAAGGDQK